MSLERYSNTSAKPRIMVGYLANLLKLRWKEGILDGRNRALEERYTGDGLFMFYTGVGKRTERDMPIEIEQILNIGKPELEPLKVASLGEGMQFIERLAAEWESGVNRFQGEGESFWGAFTGEELIGVCGLSCDPYAKHENAGRLRHLYVLPVRRREGAGRALANVVIVKASEIFSCLYLRTENPMAAAFYERLGFAQVTNTNFATHRIAFGPSETKPNVSG